MIELLNEREEDTDAHITAFKNHVMKFFDFILSQRDSQRFIAKLNDKSFTVEEIEQAINLFKKKFDLRERTSENVPTNCLWKSIKTTTMP